MRVIKELTKGGEELGLGAMKEEKGLLGLLERPIRKLIAGGFIGLTLLGWGFFSWQDMAEVLRLNYIDAITVSEFVW